MYGKWARIRKIGSSGVLGVLLLSSVVGCESTKMFLDMKPWQVHRCGMPCWQEAWDASRETPTVEASLERVNTAARLIELGELMLQGLPLSAGSLWPQEMKGTLTLSVDNFNRILQETYRHQVLYASNLGFQPSPWTGRALDLQQRLFTSPPDLHHEPSYRSKEPTESDVRELGEKVLGKGYDRMFDKNFFRLLRYHPGFIPKREIFAARFDGKAAEFHPNVMEAVWALAENQDDLKQAREAVLQGEELCERAYRDVEESAQRIRQLKAQNFGNPTTPEEAAQKGEESGSPKGLQELEAQFETEKKEYADAVNAYQVSLQQLSVALGQIKHQSGAFTVEQRALAINVQAVVDTAQGLLGGTRFLSLIVGVHLPKALPRVGQELQLIALRGGDHAVQRMKRITVNLSLLKPNLELIASESSVLDKESLPYDDLFENRINAPTIAAP
jgi:hypothetical protein